ncbi:MAG: type III pantothenate kinase [Bacteroidia bacterium]|nr:type III pantothenate kinase [Bacteroidia bacterium]
MNIIIDFGNTLAKIAITENNRIVFKKTYETITSKDIKSIGNKFPGIENAILSSVVNHSGKISDFLKNHYSFYIELDEKTPIPIVNRYKTPLTLGKDRLAGVVAAGNIFPGNDVLVIDLGTAATFDFIDKKKMYHGGNISPGLTTRFKALNRVTQKLPLLEKKEKFPLLGDNTKDAIIAGVQNGLIFEINGYINCLTEKYSNLKIILTGGDAFFFEKKLKNAIFAEPDLVILGLNMILEYNLKLKN